MNNQPTSPAAIYRERISDFAEKITKLRRIESFLILCKLAAIVSGIWAIYHIALGSNYPFWTVLGLSAGFFFISALVHERYIRKRIFILTIQQVNETELQTLSHKFPDYPDGGDLSRPDHAYAGDLDLFGSRSLFHYINRTTTAPGTAKLAAWLQAPPEINSEQICRARQAAVQELSPCLDLRQKIEARGRLITASARSRNAPADLSGSEGILSGRPVRIALIHVLPLLTFASLGYFILEGSWVFFAAMLVVQAALNRLLRNPVRRLYSKTRWNAGTLKAYARILKNIESETFSCDSLKDISRRLKSGRMTASSQIRRLSVWAGFFELREAEWFHMLINGLMLLDLHCAFHIEMWIGSFGERVPDWFDVIGSFEALSSLAGLHFNHPGWVFPDIQEAGPVLKAREIGHPLIPEADRIGNDVELSRPGSILIVTGPNMAGKSTFLKTLGVNLVLAMTGGPVCARECRLVPVRLYTSMKVSDSLDKNLSLFYAELQRLKNILEGLDRGERVFFLLDEMLKGTNALDRQTGALALLKQLASRRATGVVATHDLELTRLDSAAPDQIINRHFDGRVEGERLAFDYLLQDGPCRSVNALILMRRIGIEV